MMEQSRVSFQVLTERLDAEFYRPAFLENATTLARHPAFVPLADVSEQIKLGYTGPIDQYYGNPGACFLTSKHLVDGHLKVSEDTDRIRFEIHDGKLASTKAQTGDLLFSRTGNVGKAAVLDCDGEHYNFAAHLFAIRTAGKIDSDFLAAFFNGQFGRRQSERTERGTIIRGISIYDMPAMLVPSFRRETQAYIGEKVRASRRLQKFVAESDFQAYSKFIPFLDGLGEPARSTRVDARTIDPYRLNPGHYNDRILTALSRAKATCGTVPLGEIVNLNGFSGGATPLGATYAADGVFFARVQNVRPLRLDLSDAVYISEKQDAALSRSRCQSGDVVLTITGYPGSASVVMQEDLPLNINQHSVKFTPNQGWPPGFIAAAINSKFGRLQVDRLAIGGTRDALDYPSVRSLQIPEFNQTIRNEIASLVDAAYHAARTSVRLISASIMLVEALISRSISEEELVVAHAQLCQKDQTGDRSILNRLHQGGIDDACTPRLIPDLDSYYAALDLVQQSLTGEEMK
jgi:type I restriction enzyme S subunit